jgi:hypothetical protein
LHDIPDPHAWRFCSQLRTYAVFKNTAYLALERRMESAKILRSVPMEYVSWTGASRSKADRAPSFTSAKAIRRGAYSRHKDSAHLWFTSFCIIPLGMVSFIPDPPEPWFGLAGWRLMKIGIEKPKDYVGRDEREIRREA